MVTPREKTRKAKDTADAPKKPAPNTCAVIVRGTLVAVIDITDGKGKTATYGLHAVPCDIGWAWRIRKLIQEGEAPEAYCVCVEPDGTTHCDCEGHGWKGYCKHGRALAALASRGKIPLYVAPAQECQP